MEITKITLQENITNEKYIVSNDGLFNPFESLSNAKVGFKSLEGLNLGEKLDFAIDTEALVSDYFDCNAVVKEIKQFFLKNNFWWGDVLGKRDESGYLHLYPRNGKIGVNNLVGFVYAPINVCIANPQELLLIALKRAEIALNKEIYTLHLQDNQLGTEYLCDVWYGKAKMQENVQNLLENGFSKVA